jgi:endonuclease YncB( thermonuclease family)
MKIILSSGRGRSRKLTLASLMVIVVTVLYQACATHNTSLKSFEGQVVAVTDGDTIKVLDDQQREHKVRFAYVDAPEKGMEYGMTAKKSLSDRVYRRQVKVDIVETDRYGRTVGRVWLNDQDVNYQLVKEGWAWHYSFYAKKTQSPDQFDLYQSAEKQAREQQNGLWAGNQVMPPWDWRRNRRVGQTANSKKQTAEEQSDEVVGD